MNLYRNILIIKLKHIGDVLVATPVITALKKAYPESRITVLVNRGTEAMVTDNPAVDEVLMMDRGRDLPTVKRLFHQISFLRKIRKKGFDLVLELSGGDRGAIISRFSGARQRIGFAPKRQKMLGRHHCFTRMVKISTLTQHMVEHDLALVRGLGIEPVSPTLALYWKKEDEKRCEAILAERGIRIDKPYVALHPTSRWMFKTWHARGYAAVSDYIQNNYGLPVIITSGPAKVELQRVSEILSLTTTTPANCAGALTLKQLGCLISHARLFFGVDSAPMHMAAAVGTPAIALFGPSGDHMWGPWGQGHIVIKKDWECRPCGRDGCNGSKVSRCLEEITVEEVCAAVDKQLSTRPES